MLIHWTTIALGSDSSANCPSVRDAVHVKGMPPFLRHQRLKLLVALVRAFPLCPAKPTRHPVNMHINR